VSIAAFAGLAQSALAGDGMELTPALIMSAGHAGFPDGDAADKGKLERLTYPVPGGFETALVCIFGDEVGGNAWGPQGIVRPARDLFVTRSLDDGRTWSAPQNLSLTADLSSIAADHDGNPDTPPIPFNGDSQKPNVYSNGKIIVISWVDHYAPSGEQRTVRYPEFLDVEVPYAATYAVRSTDGGATWSAPERLTSGFRDAKQDNPKASSAGYAITWQEDPQGLQPGDAEGPGDGGSGAKVSKGTDIWYTSLTTPNLVAGMPFPEPRRITDNFTMMGSGSNEGYEYGQTGASRANLFVFGTTALVAYEETKGLEGADDGKYVRYHAFSAFDDSSPDPTSGAGWILSKPDENARRVRFVTQPGPLANSSNPTRLFIFWKQGDFDAGGPSDIVARAGVRNYADSLSTGFRPEDMRPMVDSSASTREGAFLNEPGMNLSSILGIDAGTGDNAIEDARAHRAVMRGNSIALGYSWTPDWAVARYTDLENYNFYLVRSFDGGMTWTTPQNLSQIDDTGITVKEPRLVGTPFSSDPSEVNNGDAFFIGWGTEVNQYEHLGEAPIPLEIVMTRTTDFGETYEPLVTISEGAAFDEGDEGAFEAQIRVTPAGRKAYMVWQQELDDEGGVDTLFRTLEVCLADMDDNGVVDFDDLNAVLSAYGSSGYGDINRDGIVDFEDLNAALADFGRSCN
jgi:hypothetical protein